MSDLVFGSIPPFSSEPGALTQGSPNSLPNEPGLKLGPAPNNWEQDMDLHYWWKHKLPVSIKTVIFKCTWLLVTDITCTCLLYLSVAHVMSSFLLTARKIPAALLRYPSRSGVRCYYTTCLSSPILPDLTVS